MICMKPFFFKALHHLQRTQIVHSIYTIVTTPTLWSSFHLLQVPTTYHGRDQSPLQSQSKINLSSSMEASQPKHTMTLYIFHGCAATISSCLGSSTLSSRRLPPMSSLSVQQKLYRINLTLVFLNQILYKFINSNNNLAPLCKAHNLWVNTSLTSMGFGRSSITIGQHHVVHVASAHVKLSLQLAKPSKKTMSSSSSWVSMTLIKVFKAKLYWWASFLHLIKLSL